MNTIYEVRFGFHRYISTNLIEMCDFANFIGESGHVNEAGKTSWSIPGIQAEIAINIDLNCDTINMN